MWGFFKPIIMRKEKTGALIDTGYMSHLDIPLPLKKKSLKDVWDYLPKDDDIPKQRLRHASAKKSNKKNKAKLKEARIKRKQYLLNKKIKQNEKERIKQLFQEGIKNNQDNDD
jgi:ribosomal protein L16 Arg81 hydroxylase